jgi:hypothetical protein
MAHLGQSLPATLSTESLGEWAGQPSITAIKSPHLTITSRSVDQTKTTTATTTLSRTDIPPEKSNSTHLSTTPPNTANSTTSSTLQPPHSSQGPSRSPSRTRSPLQHLHQHLQHNHRSRSRSPTPTPGALNAARSASARANHLQPQIPEPSRMTKARRAPCCQWKHEDRKHHLHMAWMHHYTPSST